MWRSGKNIDAGSCYYVAHRQGYWRGELVEQLRRSKAQRDLLERQVEVLQDQHLRFSREFHKVHADHLALTDILRLLSLGAIDYHAALGSKRRAAVPADVSAAAADNAVGMQRERERLLAEHARFREGYNLLLEHWYHIPPALVPDVQQRLAKAGLKTLRSAKGALHRKEPCIACKRALHRPAKEPCVTRKSALCYLQKRAKACAAAASTRAAICSCRRAL